MKIAGVRFRDNWKVYDFDATDFELTVGDKAIVDSDRGLGIATVVRIRKPLETAAEAMITAEVEVMIATDSGEPPVPADKPSDQKQAPAPKILRRLVRKANEDDLAKENKNREREAEAFALSQEMITERDLPMKLIRVEYSLDASRATFFFFSETRIDFRELVKDLAYKLRSRIEMRQIGVRDVARLIGGFGPCGRELCCASFLKNFEPVSIRMAKKQEMVLNPAKISGVCGRLLCCLSYEFGMYDENKKDLAGMREAIVRGKREEEALRVADERQEEDRRNAEEKKRQDERKKTQEPRREKQRDESPRGGSKAEKRREPQQDKKQPQDKKQQPRHSQSKDRQQSKPDSQQPKQEDPQQQKPEPPSQVPVPQPQGEAGDNAGKRNKKRFWRRKKKPGQGDKPQGPGAA